MSLNHHAVASPCISNCCLDAADVCLGCFRTLTEITSWSETDDQTRRQFINNAKIREMLYKKRTDALDASS